MQKSTRPRIVFEGGLGSQLLPLIEALKMKSQGVVFDVDFSYFESIDFSGNMIQRPWRLDRYGFDFDNVRALGHGRKSLLKRPQSKISTWEYAKLHAANQISIQRDALELLLNSYGLNLAENYSAVHLRRGDYLKVSSKVVSDQEVAKVLKRVSRLLHSNVFIISDSKISIDKDSIFQKMRKETGKNFHFISGTLLDECVVHDLMRMADFLVCSNSTFSFSAALLAKESATSIAPIDFFDPQTMQSVNEKFRSAGNFFILD